MLRANCQVLTAVLHSYSQRGRERFADLGWRFCDFEASSFHGCNLLGRCALAAGGDRTGVTHSASGRRCLPRDKSDDRLLHLRLAELRRVLLCLATGFPILATLPALRLAATKTA